jgi:hypothetical protein
LLNKCSNPSCRESFRYLQQGRLFRLEGDPNASSPNPKRPEYFWLCRNCAGKMTLRLDNSARVTTLRVPDQMQSTESTIDFVALDRRQGQMLSCLHFIGRPPQQDWTPTVRGKLIYAS